MHHRPQLAPAQFGDARVVAHRRDHGDRVRTAAFTLLADTEEQFLMNLAGDQRVQLNELLSRIVEL